MPIYGDEKRRQMARSTLPSVRRKAARDDLRNVKGRSRSRVRQNLRELHQGFAASEEVVENYDDASIDFNEYPDHEISEIRWVRRDREKLGPALRWAPHQVAHLRREDRLSHMYTIMPDTLAGRHAVGHMGYLPEFEIEHPHRYSYWRYEPSAKTEARERDKLLKPRLEAVQDLNLLDRFNAFSLWERPHEITEEEYEATKHEDKVFERQGPEWRYHWNRRHWWLESGDVKHIKPGPFQSFPRYYKLVMEPLILEKGSYMITEKRSDTHVNRYLRRSNGHWSVYRALKECGV